MRLGRVLHCRLTQRSASGRYPNIRRSTNRTVMTAAKASKGAYIEPDLAVEGAPQGVLRGVTFAVKDMYEVRGHVTGFGNPRWRETHSPAKSTAPAVQALLDAGGSLRGKTHMDELAYSLNGENKHYGTPVNPVCPDRIPGGSSSGSAVATAAGDVDFAIGSDTGGSVRVPAGYCGILGIRPSHGRVSLEGACPLAPSFDTGGWFARDPAVLRKVGSVLLKPLGRQPVKFRRWLIGKDAFALCQAPTGDCIYQRVSPKKLEIEQLFGKMTEVEIGGSTGIGSLQDWFSVFRVVQAAEAWKALGGWISETKPEFGPGTKERFEMASKVTLEQETENCAKREAITSHMDALLGGDAILMLPTAPGPAPLVNTPPAELDVFRTRLISLTCIAGLARLPQISIPCGTVDGCPVGLGLIGPRGSDEALLEAAESLVPLLQ